MQGRGEDLVEVGVEVGEFMGLAEEDFGRDREELGRVRCAVGPKQRVGSTAEAVKVALQDLSILLARDVGLVESGRAVSGADTHVQGMSKLVEDDVASGPRTL